MATISLGSKSGTSAGRGTIIRDNILTTIACCGDNGATFSADHNLTRQTLTEVVAQGRVVTRVAVTVRTKTFFTRTKIRKLPAASTDGETVTKTALDLLDQFELDRPIRLLGVRLELAAPQGGY